MTNLTKTCTKCQEEKTLSEFYRDNRSDYVKYLARCKVCINEHSQLKYMENRERRLSQCKQYAEQNRDKISKRMKKYYEANKERITEKQAKHRKENREYFQNWRDTHKEHISKLNKKYREVNRDELIEKSREYYYNNQQELLKKKQEYRSNRKEERRKYFKEYAIRQRQNNYWRFLPEYYQWKTAVYKRDNYICQDCGETHCKVNAHHIKPAKDYPDLRYELDNGICLCVKCHRKVHMVYNKSNKNDASSS